MNDIKNPLKGEIRHLFTRTPPLQLFFLLLVSINCIVFGLDVITRNIYCVLGFTEIELHSFFIHGSISIGVHLSHHVYPGITLSFLISFTYIFGSFSIGFRVYSPILPGSSLSFSVSVFVHISLFITLRLYKQLIQFNS